MRLIRIFVMVINVFNIFRLFSFYLILAYFTWSFFYHNLYLYLPISRSISISILYIHISPNAYQIIRGFMHRKLFRFSHKTVRQLTRPQILHRRHQFARAPVTENAREIIDIEEPLEFVAPFLSIDINNIEYLSR